jgi:predicted murein hydrolase (TIGR00659 family)
MLPLLHIWTYLQTQPLLGLTATLCTWELANWIDIRARRSALSNPVVLSILILGAALLLTHTPYKAYFRGAQYVNFLLGPATVALAVPMFNNLPAIRREFVAIVTALTAGSIVAAASAMLIARAMGAPEAVVISLGPKSVTTPIAIGIAQNLGGQPSLTAICVILTGLFGSVICTGLFRWLRVVDRRAQGLAAGTAAHGIATARMLILSQTAGAFGGVAIGLNGIVTSLFLPLLVRIFGL